MRELAAPRRFNLTAALAVAAVADLLFHRLGERLFFPQHPTGLQGVAAVLGRFAFHLGGVLGLLVLVTALVLLIRRDEFFPRAMRVAVAIIGVVFAGVAAVGILFLQLPDQFLVHLKTSQAFLAWFVSLATWRAPGSPRAKLGVTLFALPPMLHAVALFASRMRGTPPVAVELGQAAEVCALLGGALAPLLLAPDPATGKRGLVGAGAAAGVLTLAVLLAALVSRFDLVQTLALYGFRLDLPTLASPGAVTYVALVIAAFVGLVMATVWSLGDPGTRLVGYGLILTTAAGYQALSPNQVLFAACGLLALASGATHPAAVAPRAAPLLGAEAAGL
jgi:hypothetical protein